MSKGKSKKLVWISIMILMIASLFSIESFVPNAIADDDNGECSLTVLKGLWECSFSGFFQPKEDVFVPVIATGKFRSKGGKNFDGVGDRTVLIGTDPLSQGINCTLSIESQDPVCAGVAVCKLDDSSPDEIFAFALVNRNKTIFNSDIEELLPTLSGICEKIVKKKYDDDDDEED